MTNLIETYEVKVEVNHDKLHETSTVYGGWSDPKQVVLGMWPRLACFFGERGKGHFDFGNGVSLHWRHIGLEEVPEETGGDN
jgi:hypothetical protein